MKLNLRPVEKKDYEKILEWRNDPDVRINSLTQHVISIDEHIEYWTEFLKNITNFAFIVVHGHEDIGVLKLKNVNKITYEIDIFLSKGSRNKGLGPQILKLAKEIAAQKNIKRLIAKIKYDNEASKKAFERGGFSPKLIYYEAEVK
ncbi:MAG: GNAT family N-acetyltransferase [Candidatus Methanoperedens sp.]|nr:GNAT family N-acetyltransferase [Candidatus Methanoperedens sp.]